MKVNGLSPAESDIQRYFGVSPPTVHQMVVKLEGLGLIARKPGVARSIQVLVSPDNIPELK
jgi:DNA-binding MarR family transcriptional regulator